VNNRFTSRKWVLALLTIAIAIAARAAGWIDGAQFVSLVTWITGLYMAGNVAGVAADKYAAKPPPC